MRRRVLPMKKGRYTEEQIAYALRQVELGTPVVEVVRKMGDGRQRADFLPVEEAVRRYGRRRDSAAEAVGRGEPEAQAAGGRPEFRQADAAGRALKKTLRPGRRRDLVRHLEERYGVSERRGCRALRFQRSSHRYRSTAPDQAALRMRIREIAAVRVRYGYFRIYILLRREGWRVNHKR